MPEAGLLAKVKGAVGPSARAIQLRVARAFFDRGGTDTIEPVSKEELGLGSGMHPYQASGRSALRRGLRGYEVGPSDVFLDLGSGKGRVLFLAARHPFKRVIGVEISEELNEVARANLDRSTGRLKCRDVEIVTADITRYEVPDDVTVVFLGNPLDGPLFREMLGRLLESLDRRPRRMRLLYWHGAAAERSHLESTGRFTLVRVSRFLRPDLPPQLFVYETRD